MADTTEADYNETPRDKEYSGDENRDSDAPPPGNDHLGSSHTLRAESVRTKPTTLTVLATPDHIEHEARKRSTNILTTWTTLREVLRRHEATIQRRWLKKPQAKRLAVLLKAWPSMPPTHRPDFKAFRMETQEQRDSGTSHRQEYLWPYINQEDLLTPNALLLLLRARGRSLPSKFAGADGDGMRFGLQSRAVVPVDLDNYFMVLNGVDELNKGDYGRLVFWHGPETAGEDCDYAPLFRQFHPGMGLLVLEVQERLLTFLLNVCGIILHDMPQHSWTTDAFLIQPEPELKAEAESSASLLAALAAQAPYRVPAHMDLDKLVSLLAASTSAAEDNFGALREDPLYLSHELQETKEHRRPDAPKNATSKGPPAPAEQAQDNCECVWTVLVSTVLSEVALRLEIFAQLHQQAEELQALQAKYSIGAQAAPLAKELPEAYTRSLNTFRASLGKASKMYLSILRAAGPPSPPLRRFFVRCASCHSHPTLYHPKEGGSKTKLERRMLWLLQALWDNGGNLSLAGLPATVDELERLVQAEPEAGRMITPYHFEIIGDLSIISHCLEQVDKHICCAGVYITQRQKEVIEDELFKRLRPCQSVLSYLHPRKLADVSKVVDPFTRKFSYPIEKRRTKENVATLREAEQNLDDFWKYIEDQTGGLLDTATGRLLMEKRPLHRTPPWVEPPSAGKAEAVVSNPVAALDPAAAPAPVATPNPLAAPNPFSPLHVGESKPSKAALDVIPLRNKTKTRGAPNPLAIPGLDPPAPAMPDARPAPLVPIDHRALKVFRVLFYNPDRTTTPGEVAWRDFLHAMNAAGLCPQKLYGSVWQFQPTGPGPLVRAIQFHEPHPTGKIPFWVVRRHGRRLQRAYEWCGDTFILQ
jgi:hypothetical protein